MERRNKCVSITGVRLPLRSGNLALVQNSRSGNIRKMSPVPISGVGDLCLYLSLSVSVSIDRHWYWYWSIDIDLRGTTNCLNNEHWLRSSRSATSWQMSRFLLSFSSLKKWDSDEMVWGEHRETFESPGLIYSDFSEKLKGKRAILSKIQNFIAEGPSRPSGLICVFDKWEQRVLEGCGDEGQVPLSFLGLIISDVFSARSTVLHWSPL